MMKKIMMLSLLLAGLGLLGGCAGSSRFDTPRVEPNYTDLNPASPTSDWAILDITPDAFRFDEENVKHINDEILFTID